MRKLSLFLFGLFITTLSFSQAVTNRANSAITVKDERLMAGLNFFIPRYLDTTAANVAKGIDTAGAIIFTYNNNGLWYRMSSTPKKWVLISSGIVPTQRFGVSGEDNVATQNRSFDMQNSYGFIFNQAGFFQVDQNAFTRLYVDEEQSSVTSPDGENYFLADNTYAYMVGGGGGGTSLEINNDSGKINKRISYTTNLRPTFNRYTLIDKGYADSVASLQDNQRFGVIGEDNSATQNRNFNGHDTYNFTFDSVNNFIVRRDNIQRLFIGDDNDGTYLFSSTGIGQIYIDDVRTYLDMNLNRFELIADSSTSSKTISYLSNLRPLFNQYTLVDKGYADSINAVSISGGWKILGNSGTTAGTNFLGTTDNVDLVFKRNNVFAGIINGFNTSFGVNSLAYPLTGNFNTAFGTNTLSSNVGGSNTAIGAGVLQFSLTAVSNTGVGTGALSANTTGDNNTAIGSNALAINTTGSQNIAIGYTADVLSNNLTNATAIGNNSKIGVSNGISLGDSTQGTKTGIGTSFPTHTLMVRGDFKLVDGTQGANKILQSDAAGGASWVNPGSIAATNIFNSDGSQTDPVRTYLADDKVLIFNGGGGGEFNLNSFDLINLNASTGGVNIPLGFTASGSNTISDGLSINGLTQSVSTTDSVLVINSINQVVTRAQSDILGVIPTLQQVTTAGKTTTDSITTNFHTITSSAGSKLKADGFNIWNKSLTSFSITAGAATTILSFTPSSVNAQFDIQMAIGASGISQSKKYIVNYAYDGTGSNWMELLPISSTGAYATEEIVMDINISGADMFLRVRRVSGGNAANIAISAIYSSTPSTSVVVDANTSVTGATVTGFYPGTMYTQVAGKSGINVRNPDSTLHIVGGFKLVNGTQGAGRILKSDASGGASWATTGSLLGDYYINGGNSFGANSSIGNNDNFGLSIKTNNVERIGISNAGNTTITGLNPIITSSGATSLYISSGGSNNNLQINLTPSGTGITYIAATNAVNLLVNSVERLAIKPSAENMFSGPSGAIHKFYFNSFLGENQIQFQNNYVEKMRLTVDGNGDSLTLYSPISSINPLIISKTGSLNFKGALMPNGDAGTSGYILKSNGPSSPTWVSTGSILGDYFINGGNSFGADASIGTNDNYALSIKTNNIERIGISNSGNINAKSNNIYLNSISGNDASVYINSIGGSASNLIFDKDYTENMRIIVDGNGDSLSLYSAITTINPLTISKSGNLRVAGNIVAANLDAGTYTPTLSNTTNITSSTPIICHYTRNGNEVTVTGSVGVVTTLAIASTLGISLPISSNLAATTDLSGIGNASSAIATNVYAEANTANDRANLNFIGLSVGGSGTIFFTFTYTVL